MTAYLYAYVSFFQNALIDFAVKVLPLSSNSPTLLDLQIFDPRITKFSCKIK
jgi:hypothetical protein